MIHEDFGVKIGLPLFFLITSIDKATGTAETVNGCTLFHKGNSPKSQNIDGSKPTISAYQQNAEAPAILGQVEAEGRKEISWGWVHGSSASGSDFGEQNSSFPVPEKIHLE